MHAELDSIEADQRRLRLWLVAIAFGCLGLAVVGWLGRSTYRHFKERREQALAQSFLAHGDWRNALLSAQQTLQLDPTNGPACRVLAEITDRAHSPETTNLLWRLIGSEPTVENKLRLAAAGLRYQTRPFPLTTQILEELTPMATNVPGYQVMAATLALSTGHWTDA